jgi:hypothetical protein
VLHPGLKLKVPSALRPNGLQVAASVQTGPAPTPKQEGGAGGAQTKLEAAR